MTTSAFARLAFVSACAAVLLAGCERAPDVPFAPYGEAASARPDFAQVEHDHPLSAADLAKITPGNLAKLDQEQIDQIYARLSAGPIPDGPFDGTLFFPKGVSGDRRLAEIVGGLGGFVVNLKGAKLELIGRTLWKGKVFYRDQRVLRNRIEDLSILKPIIDDPQSLDKIVVDGRDAWLLFPAKLYCGQSLIDSRRESIIIDYAFSDEIDGYRERPDFLAGRRGLRVRDEIRMVRPGFYLGRAYADRAFLLNFTLYNTTIAERDGPVFQKTGAIAEDCWSGTRRVVAAAP
ncbi:MAG: hypothetical protein ABI794_16000 [Betaproteobacteria bacterium]